MFNIGLDDRY